MTKRVYTLGSSGPRVVFNAPLPKKSLWKKIKSLFKKEKLKVINSNSLQYHSFSGVDVKAYFEYKDGSVEIIAELQAISVHIDFNKNCCGTIISIVFDKSIVPKLKQVKNIVMLSANEYHSIGYSIIKDFELVSYDYGVSIDDVVSEERSNFKCSEFLPWEIWPEEPTKNSEYAMFVKTKHYTKNKSFINF